MTTLQTVEHAVLAQGLDATKIYTRLYQGSAPPPGHEVRRAGFDLLVLAAYEYQPPAQEFGGIQVLYAPMDDSRLKPKEWLQVVSTARKVDEKVRKGYRALITCQAGRNRSGIITAVTLHLLTGCSGTTAVRTVQALRANALTNDSFVARLRQIRGATLRSGV